MSLTFYGLKTCDTCRKAQKALTAANVSFVAVDVRADGVPQDALKTWIGKIGGDALVNRRSTTWRALSDAERAEANTADGLLRLLSANPTLIKRPVIVDGDAITVGWTKDVQAKVL